MNNNNTIPIDEYIGLIIFIRPTISRIRIRKEKHFFKNIINKSTDSLIIYINPTENIMKLGSIFGKNDQPHILFFNTLLICYSSQCFSKKSKNSL
jgi:hypothetical protein